MSDFTLEELETRLKDARDAAKKAEIAVNKAQEQEEQARMEPLRTLTKRAHDLLCGWNHTDGCGWGYEEDAADPWRCSAHYRWLTRYDTIINGTRHSKPEATIEQVTALLDGIEQIKRAAPQAMMLIRSGKLTP